MQTLKIIFRADKSGDFKGSVTAVFPTEAADYAGREMTCYAHVGQHGGARKAWYRTTRPARPDEYAPLLREISGIYETDAFGVPAVRLIIAKRITAADDAARHEQARQSRAAVRQDPSLAPWAPDARREAFA